MSTPLKRIPEITIDGQGYIYWKGIEIEHFSGSLIDKMYCDLLSPEGIESATRVHKLMSKAEKLGLPINLKSYFQMSDEERLTNA